MSDSRCDSALPRAHVSVATTGVSVTLGTGERAVDVAAFAWVDGVDVERWAIDFAAAISATPPYIDGKNDAC